MATKNKTCSICGLSLPEDKQHYRHRVQNGKAYFSANCRKCIAKQKAASNLRKKDRREAALAKVENEGVKQFMSAIGRGGSNIPHSAELIEQVMNYFGGVGGFSAVIVKQYWDAEPGGSQRSKLIETMCRLVSKNVEQGGAKKPLTLWTEDELEEELNARIQSAFTSVQGEIDNGEEESGQKASGKTSPANKATGKDTEGAGDLGVPKRRNKAAPKRDSRQAS